MKLIKSVCVEGGGERGGGGVSECVYRNQRPVAAPISVTGVNVALTTGIWLIPFCNVVFPPPSFNYHYHEMK